MFDKPYEARLALWKEFRANLETDPDPIRSCIKFWQAAPEVRIQADPYNQDTWPGPWELIEENIFCPFVKILAICYTLQLTDRFSQASFEIHITQAKNQISYILTIDGKCIDNDELTFKELSNTLRIEQSYPMPRLW
jgi:hypothetical protein